MIIGSSYVFSSMIFSQLNQPTSEIKLTDEEASWIGMCTAILRTLFDVDTRIHNYSYIYKIFFLFLSPLRSNHEVYYALN